ncbi:MULTISPECIES: type I restriction enzyme HsdR N-terminal domain-containing protein [Leptolyngbya]|uniref:type I restriction enzyme HsdR N-terminal domain-containing protein n=1 Tax=Leptolyngbya TaxID=47251 RepID=UPI001689F090|nr:type I restriction enzyme HsdR N-terminal domain-containing protein [Leptolyngbya sp. FACHB-1624]MBD1859698.1 type I restriction enzyme HsdR N-terminal domain-containing protein [Leptolyngbya sp. FACHB-1624]
MQTPEQRLLSEEDIRTRVVAVWLADHGFAAESISVEFSFEIRLGRGILRVGSNEPVRSPVFRPRADIVVRSCDGRNLLIVEVKAPGEPLDESAKEQGISYARLLRVGGIAPFVVLTNGNETRIYDSISGELIDDIQVPTNHPYAQNGFRVTADDLALRSEALETFISLSPDNLIEFCRIQVSERMRPLRSDDLHSGKKYIPQLYIERTEARKELHKHLGDENRRVVILAGEPQVGKTNFACRTVEQKLEEGIPCLFYPAIGIQKGLLEEIQEDFEWIIHENGSLHQIVSKLNRVLKRVGQKLIIFIDGWNEASQELARAIDKGSERLACDEIQIVISFTNVAASRLLLDDLGNPSYVADATAINKTAIPLFEVAPEKLGKTCSVVEIQKYDNEEIDRAYEIYANAYNVEIPSTHVKVSDPLVLRIGIEICNGKELPLVLDEPELLGQIIQLKAQRVVNLHQDTVTTLLIELADEMFLADAPISQSRVRKKWEISATQDLPIGLFESALLAKVFSNQKLPSIDFYYGRERDFLIAYLVRNWLQRLLEKPESICSELYHAIATRVGLESLHWFLRQPSHLNHLRAVSSTFHSLDEASAKTLILSAIRRNPLCFSSKEDWINKIIEQAIADENMLVRVEAAKLIAEQSEDEEWLASILVDEKDLEKFITKLLETDEEYPLEIGGVGQVILDAFKRFGTELCFDDPYESDTTPALINLLNSYSSSLRRSAAKVLGYTAPRALLDEVSKQLVSGKIDLNKEFIEGIKLAISTLFEDYFGSFGCPGSLEALSDTPDELRQEYINLYGVSKHIATFYHSEKCINDLLRLLQKIWELVHEAYECRDKDQILALQLPPPSSCFTLDPEYVLHVYGYRQLSLPIDGLDIKTGT